MYGYKERKAAQVAAFFTIKSGGTINVLKLTKLLYLSERESMSRFDEPMFFDRLVSMDFGPVPSITLNLINRNVENDHWSAFLGQRMNMDIEVMPGIDLDDLDDLNRADLRILSSLWDQFGGFDRFALAKWTHDNCPEWKHPSGSSLPIEHDYVFKFLGKENAEELALEVSAYRKIAQTLETC
ncbi:MAG: SocA family protein [Rhodobacteraceae bacterium]|nr:SocA family protein [Paracoccaceae bacterium]